jgi:hypothetical protein
MGRNMDNTKRRIASSSSWTREEKRILTKLSTPAKIQDFLNTLKYRVVGDNETCSSPRKVLRERKAQCIEGAILAAAALRFHGYPPLIVDLEAHHSDLDHVIAVYKKDGYWGALSKTNHGVLRYREPIYRSIRELVISYFHEYFLQNTRVKTLRTFSRPINLARFDKKQWETNEDDIWFVANHLLKIPHTPLLTKKHIANLRKADDIEKRMGELTEWPPKKKHV